MKLYKVLYKPNNGIFNIFAHKTESLKKLFTILILAIMAFSQIGYYVLMHRAQLERKEYIKAQIHKNIADNVLTVVDYSANKSKIFWEDEGKEFFFEGEMYDLVNTKSINGKIYFYCLNDEKEKDMINAYNDVTKNNSSSNKKANQHLYKVFSPYEVVQLCLSFPLNDLDNKYPSTVSNIEKVTSSKTLKPPQYNQCLIFKDLSRKG